MQSRESSHIYIVKSLMKANPEANFKDLFEVLLTTYPQAQREKVALVVADDGSKAKFVSRSALQEISPTEFRYCIKTDDTGTVQLYESSFALRK